jgi:wyosine [tRNA(Phe)-imidazoG37] synthetase (radical SAM superfamily)
MKGLEGQEMKGGLRGHREHPRQFQGKKYVYPVLSRRSKGVSIGVNLCPEKLCNFNCLYCQVQRTGKVVETGKGIVLDVLEGELNEVVDLVQNGELYNYAPFDEAPEHLRRLNDIALSGDGEPTAAKEFTAVCQVCAKVRQQKQLDQVKIILITNASLLHKEEVQRGLEVLDHNGGEIWAKLDAGNEAYFRFINQSEISYDLILDNIFRVSRERPIVIQTLFVRFEGERVPRREVEDYADRLGEIISRGGKISLVQLHTVARAPREARVSSLSTEELKQISEEIHSRVNIPIEIYS